MKWQSWGPPPPPPSELCPFVAGLVANESFLGCPGVPLSMLCSHPLQTAFTVTCTLFPSATALQLTVTQPAPTTPDPLAWT